MSTPEIVTSTALTPMIEAALAQYNAPDATIAEMGEMFADLKTNGPEDKKAIEAVREARLNFRNFRLQVEKTRERLKADSLTFGQAIDGESRRIKALIEPHESRLKAEAAKVTEELDRRAAEAARLVREETERRVAVLSEMGVAVALSVVEAMSLEQFAAMLAIEREKAEKAAEEAARAAEEAKRVAAEQAAEAERLAVQRRETDEREAAQRKVATDAAAEAARAQAKLDAERIAFEAEKAEAARKEQAAAEAVAEAARAEARAAEQARKAEAAKAEQARIDVERVAEERRVASLGPIERIAERLDDLALVLACAELSGLAAELREVTL